MFQAAKTKVTNWMKNEQSASLTTENGMLMLGGIALAVGVGFLVSQYMRDSSNTVLTNMDTVAAGGIDPDTNPSGTPDGWVRQ
ncbi:MULTISPECIES: hypothetical protein [Paenibacillus]|uniref:Uncharacterized protein n=1 Tax=Paenibacillus vandeheii TaxID=3035917 RepID=A0ABT8JGC9_9BACL|nr:MULTISPECIES: hypothetical protein [Paenibacillus]KGP81358.1 hypothetical protein P363_0128090 [Paenibacillus sp. MAEPY1]KGP81994.1 hypothetical protein P364_0114345 [Paenibacillus sp. MAEPY2]MDN4603913.1 hypothetical protein [Paenibacillus vandeheii]